ncbi:MAG: YibE/F family protein, partial [Bacteroidota bacterium]
DIYRLNVELVLFLIFALFLFCFAGWTGAKALLSFLFTALTIWKLLIPFFLKGYDPVWISVLMTSLCTVVIILLIGGFTRKSMVALSGSVSGVVVTALLATIFGYYFQIPGTVREFAEPLMYNGFFDLDFSKIFIAGIFISAAGAVMDVAMDIAASQEEIALRHPGLPARELVLSGFRISRAVIGTMTTTLLFAYSGSYTFVLMLLMAKGMPMINIFNTNYIASEIFQTLVGSFGLVLVAPLTSLIGAFVYSKTINTKISQS